MKSKKQNLKKQKKTSRKQTSRKQTSRKQKSKIKSIVKPVVLYSSKTPNSEEVLEEINDTDVKTTIYKSESKIPPTIIEKQNGSMIMSMHQKRNMVIKSYH
jgi:hypothetical protein